MSEVLDKLYEIILQRLEKMPENSYTAELVKKGKGYIARKVGEEAVETIVASLYEGRDRFISEAADLMYHLWVLMAVEGVKPEELYAELKRRMK
ncbi:MULTISPECIES: phosphoribosyl-ATP diphosphatase [Acidianus]|jgi:phosphoribosyl-ATP pyrophosphohydrolase|uniref:Phosphoribosyl-ATP pyrophosphatase n=3 Tax=Acidianus TaxID=12914 RepID=A0A650CSA4_ACIAM|nr:MULTISPECIES: phosphoribosyl-ATP diphosphatase [Acidianus]AEE94029.1 phosphoribosyl-ATP diphosphatase [Acidianus hospitalis W1]MDT7900331.1 phosphoribosyl-ATP diphosphatase [Acidianus sp.]MQL55136.1 phosphoribosyl-ATP diphosphatase [Acidianus ambivalens]QGR20686.1 phosphoribosyl-ATP diphosphatase [Acidianus ambivalens]